MEVQNILINYLIKKDLTNYGSEQNPLFQANKIGDLIKIKNIRQNLANLDLQQKQLIEIKTTKRKCQPTWALTMSGIYQIFSNTRNKSTVEILNHLDINIMQIFKEIPEKTFAFFIFSSFQGECIIPQYKVQNYRIDLYFLDYQLAIEVDENYHTSTKQQKKDIIRQKNIEKEINCHFIRIKQNDDKFFVINQIYRYIKNKLIQNKK